MTEPKKPCPDCGKGIALRSKRCRGCHNATMNGDPERRRKAAETMRRKMATDPEYRRLHMGRLADGLRRRIADDPAFAENRRQMGRQIGGWNKGLKTPADVLLRRGQAISNARLPKEVPLHLRDQYRNFMRRYGKEEALRLIAEHIAAEVRRVQARFEAAGFSVETRA